jgi:TP901-1 family phage major tail protein
MAETTGIINGSNLKIMLAAEGGTELMINNLTDCSISTTVDMRDTTTKSNSGYKDMLPGLMEASISFTGMFANDATTGFAELFSHQNLKTKLDVKLTQIVGSGSTPNTGDKEFEAAGYITSLDLSGGTEDNSSFSCTIQLVEDIAYNAIP